jgi:hypothetical protein
MNVDTELHAADVPEARPHVQLRQDTTGQWGSRAVAAAVASLLAACGGGDASDEAQTQLSAGATRVQPELLPRPVSNRQTSRAARTPTASEVFDWAQRQFPAIFSSNEANMSAVGGLVFRFYPGTGHYLAVLEGNVLVLGPLTQGQVTNVGPLTSFTNAVGAGSTSDKPSTDEQAARFLLHAQFSASETEIATIKDKGYAAWLDEQLALPSSQSGWDWLVSKGFSAIDTNEFFFQDYLNHYMVWYQLMKSPDAVRRRWAWALSEVFVVALRGINGCRRQFKIDHLCQLNFDQGSKAGCLAPGCG